MDIDKYPEISVELFYSKPTTTPRGIFAAKSKVVHEKSTRQLKETVKLAKSSPIRKAREKNQEISGSERKRKALVDASKDVIKKAKLEIENAAPIDNNNNSLKDPARVSKRKRSPQPFKIFVSKNLDDNNNINDNSYDDLEKSIKDYEENAPKHAKMEKDKKSDLPAQYLGSNVSFDDGNYSSIVLKPVNKFLL